MASGDSRVLPYNSKSVLAAKAVGGKQTEWRIKERNGKGVIRGLVLLCQPSGRASYWFYYRAQVNGQSKLRKLLIGNRDAIDLSEAADRALEHRRLIATGADPVAAQTAKANALTFQELAERRLNADDNLAASTRKFYRDLLEGVAVGDDRKAIVGPYTAFGRVLAVDVTPELVRSLLDQIVARGAKAQRDRTKSAIGSVYKWAQREGLVPLGTDPTRGLGNRAPAIPRRRVVSEAELRRFLAVLDDQVAPISGPMRLIFRIALLTGQRRAEVAGARISELRLDGDNPEWIIPGDPPPLKWSSLMYGFSPELEDHDADEETQAGRDRREAAAG